MVITWKGLAQHTDRGLIRPGDVVDTAERGIPEEAVKVWIRDGDAVEVKAEPQALTPPRSWARAERKRKEA